MSYNGSGTFNINTAGQPVVTGTVISSSVFNALTADLATGLSTAITKDGQTTITNNIPFNGYKITNLGAGTASTDAARVGQIQSGATTAITVSGTDTYTGTMSPALAAYGVGNVFTFVVPNTNTSSCTLNIDGLGAKSITRDGSTALIAGDLVSGSEVTVVYDGTRFQVLNSNSKTNFNVSTLLKATTLNLTNALGTSYGGTGLTSFTANGVVYASSSSALATGSALTFNGTTLGVTQGNGTGTTSLAVQGGASGGDYAIVSIANGATVKGRLVADASSSNFRFDTAGSASGAYVWLGGASYSEYMRLDSSGNLGLGTSSPGQKLEVNGNIRIADTYSLLMGAGAEQKIFAAGSANNTYLTFNQWTGSAYTERMRIDQSGNLGLGVTPNWDTTAKVFQTGALGKSFLAGFGSQTYTGFNAYYNGGWKYKSTAAVSLYQLDAGTHAWFNAASGTADTAISFTQAMTLDASGRLGIGTTSPGYMVDANGGSTTDAIQATVNGSLLGLKITQSNTSQDAVIRLQSNGHFYDVRATGTGNAFTIGYDGTERARIDSSGNLGLGVTPSAWGSSRLAFEMGSGSLIYPATNAVFQLAQNAYYSSVGWTYKASTNASIYSQDTGAHIWYTAPSGTAGNTISFTQAMTLDASGNLGVGTTSPADAQLTTVVSVNAASGYCGFRVMTNGTAVGRIVGSSGNEFRIDSLSTNPLTFYTNNTERARIDSSGNLLVGQTATGLQNSNSFSLSAQYGVAYVNHLNGSGSGAQYAIFGYNGSNIGSIDQNGTTGVLYNSASDYRLKTLIAPVSDAGSRIDALKPVEFEWKSDGKRSRGFFAHEFQQVYANSVTGEKDGVDEEGKPIYQAMQASTAEVIADLVAELQSLRARVAQLESR